MASQSYYNIIALDLLMSLVLWETHYHITLNVIMAGVCSSSPIKQVDSSLSKNQTVIS